MVQNFKINKLHLQLVTSDTCLLHFALDSTLGIGLAPAPLYLKMVPMVLLLYAFDHLGLAAIIIIIIINNILNPFPLVHRCS